MGKLKMNFNVLKEIAILNTSVNGWTKEVNLISWNGAEPKYDIRWWPPGKKKIGKGMTLTPEELIALGKVVPDLSMKRSVLTNGQ